MFNFIKIETESWSVVVDVDDVNDDLDVVPVPLPEIVSSFDGQVVKRRFLAIEWRTFRIWG
jgi:hypothetical protein